MGCPKITYRYQQEVINVPPLFVIGPLEKKEGRAETYVKNTPYRFNAKELDEETGLYYYGARYYNPMTSVWLSVDPITKAHESPYSAFSGNPVMFIDPDGRDTLDITKNSDGIWGFTGFTSSPGSDVIRVNDGGEVSTHVFDEGDYGDRVNALNLEVTDDYTLGVYHVSGSSQNAYGYYVAPGGESSYEEGSNKRIPDGSYSAGPSGSAAIWRTLQIYSSNEGSVTQRGIKVHPMMIGTNPRGWTRGCFVLSSNYSLQNGRPLFTPSESLSATNWFHFNIGATSVYQYDDPNKSYNRMGAEFSRNFSNFKFNVKTH